MARDRARSSFTVEVRRGRGSTGSTSETPDLKRVLWRGVDLAAATPPEPVAPPPEPSRDVFQAAARPTAAPKRILPSLIGGPAAEPEVDVKVALAKPARSPRPRVARPVQAAAIDGPVAVAKSPLPRADQAPPVERTAEQSPRTRQKTWRGDRVLKAGERWKRRLPRACW